MISVIASVHVKAGKISEFLDIFKAIMPEVRKEKGCIEYFPAVDVDTKLPPQILDENVVTIIEKWANLKALRDHLGAPHMVIYRKRISYMLEGVTLKVLQEA